MSEVSDETYQQLSELLGKVWHNVVTIVNKLLDTHRKYGYANFEEELKPSIEELIEGFKEVDSALTGLMETDLLNFEEYKNAINSKQCILNMNLLAAALKAGAKEDYERIIDELDKQPKL